jgi:hypothetical protein
MTWFQPSSTTRGISLIGMLVAVGVVLIVFVGVAGIIRLALATLFQSEAQVGARAIAVEQIERIRSMPYSAVGTQGGIPDGELEQTTTVTRGGVTYERRTFIQYIDDDGDGTGAADTNGITADYKRAKVAVSWERGGQDDSYAVVTDIVPGGVETVSGGGTLKVNVINADANPVQDAEVSIYNDAPTSTVSVTTYTGPNGTVSFPGTPAESGYEVTVSKLNHSKAQTYAKTASNTDPTPGHLTVVEGDTTSQTMRIDRLAALTIKTLERFRDLTFVDTFDSGNTIASSTDVTRSGGSLTLADAGGGVYESDGVVRATTTAPAYLDSWQQLTFNATTDATTAVSVQLLYRRDDGSYAPVPDSALSGNTSGFSSSPVDLSGLSTDQYDALAPRATLTSGVATHTPSLASWELSYRGGPAPLANVGVSLRLDKEIGTDGSGNVLYKYTDSTTTDATGSRTLADIEWGTYYLAPSASATYDIAALCPSQPVSVEPDTLQSARAVYAADGAHTLRVSVRNVGGDTINDASVTLSRSSYSETRESKLCGQAFFVAPGEGTSSDGDAYTISVTHPVYGTTTQSGINVSDDTLIDVIMN